MEPLAEILQNEHLSTMCQYTNKRCFNERAVKRDGKLHKMCEFHRRKANANQRRLERRRRSNTADSPSSGARRSQQYPIGYKARPTEVIIRLVCGSHSQLLDCQPAASMTIEELLQIATADALHGFSTNHSSTPVIQTTAAMSSAASWTTNEGVITYKNKDWNGQAHLSPRVAPTRAGDEGESWSVETPQELAASASARDPPLEWLDGSLAPAFDSTSEWALDAASLLLETSELDTARAIST